MTIRWRLADELEERGITAYRLAMDAGVTPSAVYKILKKGDALRHVDVATLEALATALGVTPLSLLEHVSAPTPRASRAKGSARGV